MAWRDLVEKDLHKIALTLLRSQGTPECPEDPSDHYRNLRINGVWNAPLYIHGNLEQPHEIEICVERSVPFGDEYVLAKDINGYETMDMYQEAENPIYCGMQLDVYEALKRYSVLDELANL